MKIGVIAFTRSGSRYAKLIEEAMEAAGRSCRAWGKGAAVESWGIRPLEESLREWTGRQFAERDALIFIGAAGIALRAIAPFIKSKTTDPAVLCMDEQGKFVISLLSGHLGGANALTEEVAALTGALPVITTATDINQKFSVDDFARKRNLSLDNLKLAKRISAEILEGRKIGFYSDFEIQGKLPKELSLFSEKELFGEEAFPRAERPALGIVVSIRKDREPFLENLRLTPRIVSLGIGCKRGTDREAIESLARKTLEREGISWEAISKVASIDLKKEEAGLLAFCEELGLPFVTYSKEELEEVALEESFSESDFVKSITGVGNVCERSALKASGGKCLLVRKTAERGVTVAAALEDFRVVF